VYFYSDLAYINNIRNGKEPHMNVQDAMAMASRLESIIRRTRTFAKSRDEVLEEILFVVEDLQNYADRLDEALYADYCSEMELIENSMEEKLVSRAISC